MRILTLKRQYATNYTTKAQVGSIRFERTTTRLSAPHSTHELRTYNVKERFEFPSVLPYQISNITPYH